jgi:hypothetical protein
MGPILDAIVEINSRGLGERLLHGAAAKMLGVDRTTLSRCHRGVQGTNDAATQ